MKMKLIDRIKNMLLNPKIEWEIVESEETDPKTLMLTYLLPLALISAIASFIGFGLIGQNVLNVHIGSFGFGIRQAVTSFISTVVGAFVTAYVIDYLATYFGAQKNLNQAFKLVTYSYTPMMVAGILFIIPSLSILVTIAGLYGLYLLYIGLQPLMKCTDDKKTSYFVISIIVVIVVYAVLGAIFGALLLRF